MTPRVRRGHLRRVLATVTAVVASVAAVIVIQVPGAQGAFLAKIANNTDTAASNPYFTCAAAAQGETATQAYFAYPFSDTTLLGVLPVTDVSGRNNTGNYSTTGVTTNVPNTGTGAVCPRDGRTVVTLDGANGYISGPNSLIASPGPAVFTEEIWFKTSSAQGKLIGYGSARTGSSGSYDRHLYIDTNGLLVFGVYAVQPGGGSTTKIVTSTAKVTDNVWHYAAATLSSAGMALYLDGQQVATDSTTTTAQSFAGYWRIGYDNLNAWPNQPASYYFKGNLAFASVYNVALSAAQIAQHYAAGR